MLSIRELRDRAVIRPVKRAVEDQLLDIPGVVAVDIGEKHTAGRRTGRQAIVVVVARKKPTNILDGGTEIPGDVLGIPTDVIEEEPTLHHLRCPSQEWARRYGGVPSMRTALAGGGVAPGRTAWISGHGAAETGEFRCIGTLGALVVGYEHGVVNPDPRRPGAGSVGGGVSATTMGLTTFDVACMDDAWSVGDDMVDPDSGQPYADLGRAALSGRVDAAAVTLRPGFDPSCGIEGLGNVTGQCAAYPGEIVVKRGYGTGVTTGVVRSTDITLRIDHGDALGARVLREQLRVQVTSPAHRFAAPGDAGATLLNTDGRVIGLHVGGSQDGTVGYACPIGDVLAELDVDLCVAPERLHV